MLHRRFKSSKCKTRLKLATSRIKVLKNKKLVQLTQMKGELAQLIQSGKHQTAKIRVEHVVREEKMLAAYELIEIYCEHIAARLPIIESQKVCPIDSREAITGVVFASLRCPDIPDLVKFRKYMAIKYGKEFISSATELRPNCGVSRMLVEKLSVASPDIQTKMMILSVVAKDHDIKWDPESFSETDPGNAMVGSSENNPRREQRSFLMNHGSSFNGEGSAAGMRVDRLESREKGVFHGESGRLKMEFRDATAAAQAAAESAERASVAARAAVHLSSRPSGGGPLSKPDKGEDPELSPPLPPAPFPCDPPELAAAAFDCSDSEPEGPPSPPYTDGPELSLGTLTGGIRNRRDGSKVTGTVPSSHLDDVVMTASPLAAGPPPAEATDPPSSLKTPEITDTPSSAVGSSSSSDDDSEYGFSLYSSRRAAVEGGRSPTPPARFETDSDSDDPEPVTKPAVDSVGFSRRTRRVSSAQHVHPKLPDYDTIFSSLHLDRS